MGGMNKKSLLVLAIAAFAAAILINFRSANRKKHSLTIEQAKELHEKELMAINGVAGVGIGECGNSPCIKVYLENGLPELKNKIPLQMEGFPVEAETSGPFKALSFNIEQAIALIKRKYPELKNYPSDSLPPRSIAAESDETGWNVAFIQNGSGKPVIAARCFRVYPDKTIKETGEFIPRPGAPSAADFSAKDCR